MFAEVALVAFTWGATNVLLKRAAGRMPAGRGPVADAYFLATNYRYVLPLLVNLAASLLFYRTLGGAPLSTVVPLTNALALACTAVFGVVLGDEQKRSIKSTALGVACISMGFALIHQA